MKTFKQFIKEMPGDEDMGIIQGLAGATVLGTKLIQGLKRTANRSVSSNKKLNKKISNTRRGL
tara:strand:+ start:60 stop:248 length:189 start_codon:yes stop_codon:yes gene_type:complete